MGMPKGTILGEKAEREPASAPGNNIHKPKSITVFDSKKMILSMEDSSRNLQERVEYVIDIVDDLMD